MKKRKPDPRCTCCACGQKPEPVWAYYLVCAECLRVVRDVQRPVSASMLFDIAEAMDKIKKKHGVSGTHRFIINGFKA